MEQRLIELLQQAGSAHHRAYSHSNGEDADWALWYAHYLHSRVQEQIEKSLTISELVYLLVAAERARTKEASSADWPAYYARFFVENMQ
jgi:hypothetical protein